MNIFTATICFTSLFIASFVMSAGGSDDGVSVACMLELARVLVAGPPLPHPVILLFNGAEESNQQGAHGFITQHERARSVRAIINLEAMGAGGKELMFQCNSAWVARVYQQAAPYPEASVVSHELFKNLFWRFASTDWATFIEYGPPGVVGIDTAYIEEGYVYHTTFDTEDAIPDGTIKHTGENLLAFVRALAYAPEMDLSEEERAREATDWRLSSAVFFDVFGLVCVTYSGVWILALHIGAALMGFYQSCTHFSRKGQSKAVGKDNGKAGWGIHDALNHGAKKAFIFLAPILAGAAVGLLYLFSAPMRWYSGGILVALCLYLPPTLLAVELAHAHTQLTDVEDNLHATIFFSSVCLLLGACVGALSVYLFFLILVWSFLSSAVAAAANFNSQNQNRGGIYKEGALDSEDRAVPYAVGAMMQMVLMAPLVAYLIHFSLMTLTLFIPILGKTGTVVPSDVLVGALSGLCVSLLSLCPLTGITITNFPLAPPTALVRPLGPDESSVSASASVTLPHVPTDDGSNSRDDVACVAERSAGVQASSKHQWVRAAVALCLATFAFYCSKAKHESYSVTRPKRLWVQHIMRNFTAVGGGVDSGVWVSGFDSQGLQPLRSLNPAIAQTHAAPLFPFSRAHSTATATATAHAPEDQAVVSSTSLANADSDATLAASSPPADPKTLPLLDRELAMVDEHEHEVSAVKSSKGAIRDKGRGRLLRQHVYSFEGPNARGFGCGMGSIECYAAWPWYFPVAEAIRDSVYFPAVPPPIPEPRQLLLWTHSWPAPAPVSASGSPGRRHVLLQVRGPTHLTLIIDDGTRGRRIPSWGLHRTDEARARYRRGDAGTETALAQFEALEMEATPPVRPEGVHYVQIGNGHCPVACTWTFGLEVLGPEPVHVTAYAHYVEMKHTPEMDKLDAVLPSWSLGAEWTHFTGSLAAVAL